MVIRSIRHKGLRRLIEDDNAKGVRPDMADRVRKILTALILAENMDGFFAGAPPGWRVHHSPAIARASGASRRPAIGGSRSRKTRAQSTT